MADWVTFSMIKDYFYTSLESMEKGKVPKMHTIDITVNEKTWLWFQPVECQYMSTLMRGQHENLSVLYEEIRESHILKQDMGADLLSSPYL